MTIALLIEPSEPCGNCGVELGAHQQPHGHCPRWTPFQHDEDEADA